MSFLRPTLRLRLTLIYSGLLIGVGVLMLLSSYLLMRQAFDNGPQFGPGYAVQLVYADGRFQLVDAQVAQKQVQAQAQESLLRRGLLALGLVGVAGTVGGYFLAGRALRPLQAVTSTARRLSTETLNQRIELTGPDDELKELAETFNGMIARLEAAFDSQRRFVANASHELRTPLAVMRTEVDVTLRDRSASTEELRRMAVVVRSATDRADRLVNALLLLAQTDVAGRDGLAHLDEVSLPGVVESALQAVQAETGAAGLRLEVRLEPAIVLGDSGLLERLAGNLVENAVRHNQAGGWLGVRTLTVGGRALLTVANTGSLLDPTEVPGLFEPFRRGGAARTATRGAGLGLSIVRAVAVAHGGTVNATALPAGGLEVVADLPAR